MSTKKMTAKYVQVTLELIENLGLLVIMIATVIAGYDEVINMVARQEVNLGDLLLMFLYL